MEIFGCGFNGFGQLLPQVPIRCILSPAKIDSCRNQNIRFSTTSKTSTLPKLFSSWSTTYILTDSSIFLLGFCNGQKGISQRLERAEGVGISILDMAVGAGEKLYYVLANGECIVTDVHSNQNSKVLVGFEDVGESERPYFLGISAGEMNTVAMTDKSSGMISSEKQDYIFRPFDCTLRFSQVSCGKEHVILLSQNHQVFTFGLGSRGQLGHGSTDREGQPRLVEAIEGVPMATVSAGGWHSASVSAIGDLYIWGWNESGQLGFLMQRTPSKTDKNSSVTLAAYQARKSQDKLNSRMKRTLEDESSRTAHPQDSDFDQESAKKRRLSDCNEGNDLSQEQLLECGGTVKSFTHTDDNCDGMYMVNEEDDRASARNIPFRTSDEAHEDDIRGKSEKQFENLNKTGDEMSTQGTQCQDISKQNALFTASEELIKSPERDDSREQIERQEVDLESRSRGDAADDDDGAASDVVLFHALPAILDLPGGKDVSKVSCGSRHTAAISVDGDLYTWGWGAYGQLGHGGSKTLDAPTLVETLPEDQKVLDVSCGAWNTFITVAVHS